VLYRALGQGEAAQADIFSATLPNPGYLMICSDGLWGVVDEDEMERIVNSAASPYQACQQLVEAANAAGGPDNISVILARLVN
jgi:serine/threonine protein phosphatase PrpC